MMTNQQPTDSEGPWDKLIAARPETFPTDRELIDGLAKWLNKHRPGVVWRDIWPTGLDYEEVWCFDTYHLAPTVVVWNPLTSRDAVQLLIDELKRQGLLDYLIRTLLVMAGVATGPIGFPAYILTAKPREIALAIYKVTKEQADG